MPTSERPGHHDPKQFGGCLGTHNHLVWWLLKRLRLLNSSSCADLNFSEYFRSIMTVGQLFWLSNLDRSGWKLKDAVTGCKNSVEHLHLGQQKLETLLLILDRCSSCLDQVGSPEWWAAVVTVWTRFRLPVDLCQLIVVGNVSREKKRLRFLSSQFPEIDTHSSTLIHSWKVILGLVFFKTSPGTCISCNAERRRVRWKMEMASFLHGTGACQRKRGRN